MPTTLAEMTPAELRAVVEEVVHDQLVELLGDEDEGLELRPEIRDRLLRQRQEVLAGERGTPLDQVLAELGL